MPKFVHVEIPAVDLRRAKAFYSKLFGWSFRDFDRDYTLILDGGETIGGIYRVRRAIPRPDRRRPQTRAYVAVEDIDTTLKAIRRARGTIVEEKQEVPGMGWWAGFADPQGAVLYLWQRMPQRAEAGRPATAMNLEEEGREVSREAQLVKG